MNKDYSPGKIEEKWQKYWEKIGLYRARDFRKNQKYYVLVEFPYPSGDGLHVGHARSYSCLDAVARKKRMEGFNVLFPFGWDAFGLPAENYAIKTGIHPAVATAKNIANFKRQAKMLGLSFDWSREINTTDPKYYKWTQWIFLQLFKHGLAYQAEVPINWCPSCKIGLANEEVIDGKCERCGAQTVKKIKKQWMLKITAYADRLINGLENIDYPASVKEQQINWIGRSEGVLIKFKIQNSKFIEVFTTRADTLFGATYLVVAPEHKFIANWKSQISNFEEVENYIKESGWKNDLERTELAKEKTGVELRGVKAINPANNEEIPIFVADYVLASYGTGAIMAVPAHDQRDFEFAKKYNLPIEMVICPNYPKPVCPVLDKAYEGGGHLVNSGKFTGMPFDKAKMEIAKFVGGKKAVNYKLRDWIFSRQRYWGEPIPIIHCAKCGIVPLREKDLPVKLPYVKRYKPTETGDSPLANIKKWVNVKCPKCGGKARRETDVMPNWAGSSWYFMRYADPKNNKNLADIKKLKYWMPVDWYNGGMEHTTLHLLYSRFWHKFLYDIGVAPQDEPYKKRTSHGMILAEDGRKMSKSLGNVVSPDDVVKKYGADTLRLYEMFIGPFDQAIAWDTNGLEGVARFLNKVWRIIQSQKPKAKSQKYISKFKNNDAERLVHKTIKKIDEDLGNLKFNTAVSSLMILVNGLENNELSRDQQATLLKLLAPFAPHISEELWHELGNKDSICNQKWPKYNSKFIIEEEFDLIIQINGKIRDQMRAPTGITEEEAKKIVLEREKVKRWTAGKEIKKIIFVPKRLINIVI